MSAVLILAINPGNSHSPTLARLARELKGFELIGADSCVIAITAINERVPDLVLLPDRSPRGENELLARLRAVPRGVPTLKLPPVASADPVGLAKEIRAILAERATAAAAPARPPGLSPQVVAAAKATIDWARARRSAWAVTAAPVSFNFAVEEPGQRLEPANVAPLELGELSPERREPLPRADEPAEPVETTESRDLFGDETPSRSRLPQLAAIGGVLMAVAAGGWFWSRSQGPAGAAVAPVNTPSAGLQPTPTATPAGAPAIETSPPAGMPSPPAPDAISPSSGWVAVSAPFDVTILNGNQTLALDQLGRAPLAAGRYRLRFQNDEVGYDEIRPVEVRATLTTPISLTPQTRLIVKSTQPAEVLIDGTRAGRTPFQGRMPFGQHTITVRGSAGERQFQTEPTLKPVQLEVDFSTPEP